MPRQFYRTFVHTLGCIQRIELRGLSYSFGTDAVAVEFCSADSSHNAVGVGVTCSQLSLGIRHTRSFIHLILTVGMQVGSTVFPAEFILSAHCLECVGRGFFIVYVYVEPVAKAFGVGVGGPGEDDTVFLLIHIEVINRYRACSADRHRCLCIIALCGYVPEFRLVINIVGRCGLVGVVGVGVGVHV